MLACNLICREMCVYFRATARITGQTRIGGQSQGLGSFCDFAIAREAAIPAGAGAVPANLPANSLNRASGRSARKSGVPRDQ